MAGKRIVIGGYMPCLDLNGNPVAGAKLRFYENGTTTLKAIYTSAALTTQHPNPIIANAAGQFASIFADENDVFSVEITDSNDLPISGLRNRDNVRPSYWFGQEAAESAADTVFTPAGTGAVPRPLQDKVREIVSVTDFGASSSATAAVNTAAIQAAMAYLMDKFDGEENFYPAGGGDPSPTGLDDFTRRDRRTGRIFFPAGRYKVQPEVFSSLEHDRAPYVAFEFVGEHRYSSVLQLETGGAEAWFFKTSAGEERYQILTFRSLGFTTDNYLYGGFAKVYSSGGPKQFTVEQCQFNNLQKYMQTEGTGNADLMQTIFSLIECYGDMLTLDNDQSVQHDYIGTDFRCWGSMIRVKQHGGGNVTIRNGFIDFIWDERVSPAGGMWMFTHDADASIGSGNCGYKWEDCRVEVEAYALDASDPPIGIVKTVENVLAFPRISFDNVHFINGRTYPINSGGTITGSGEYRRITAFEMWPGKQASFDNGVLLKNFFYEFDGDRDTDSPIGGGIIQISNSYDGITTELPTADSALANIHDRATYNDGAGRLITTGMLEHTTGSSFTRKLLDADPNWRQSFAREPGSVKKVISFKHEDNGWPFADSAGNDHYLDLPSDPGILALRIFISMPASGAVTNAYQLHLKTTDRSGSIVGSSTLGQFKDAHVIDLSFVDLVGVSRLCLCADGDGEDFRSGGYAIMEYV